MTKTVCLINNFYNSNMVVKAVNSVKYQVDEVVIIGNSKPYSNNTLISTSETAVGNRYLYALSQIDADYYFLLDYDDIFNKNKVSHIEKLLKTYAVVKETKINTNVSLIDNIIKYNIDWHISMYSFNDDFKNFLINNLSLDYYWNASFDKILFAMSLMYNYLKLGFSKIYTDKIYHNNSKMNTLNKNNGKKEFHYNTASEFKLISTFSDKKPLNEYIEYQVILNDFLSEPTIENYNILINNYNIPIYKKAYYKYILSNMSGIYDRN